MVNIFNIIKKSTGKDSVRKKLLLIGAGGMLGQDLHETLSGEFDVVTRVKRETDVTLMSDIRRVVEKENPQIIVNASGYTDVDGSEIEKKEAYLINQDGAKHLACLARERDALIVQFGTDYIFDGKKGEPYTEEDPPSPLGVYGESKLEGEREIIKSGARHLIIRTQWLFGRHGKNFVFSIVDRLKRKGSVEVVDDQVGCPTYTRDLAEATGTLLSMGLEGTFHFSGEGETSWFGFARTIGESTIPEKITVHPVKTVNLNLSARRPAYSVLSKKKYSNATGRLPRRWESMLEDFLRTVFEGGVAW